MTNDRRSTGDEEHDMEADAELAWLLETAKQSVKVSQTVRTAVGNGALTGLLDVAAMALQRHLISPQSVKDTVTLAREARANRAAHDKATFQTALVMQQTQQQTPQAGTTIN